MITGTLENLSLCLLGSTLLATGADFVEIITKTQSTGWPHRDPLSRELGYMRETGTNGWKITCIVGTNLWFVGFDVRDTANEAWWFDGTQVVHRLTVRHSGDRLIQSTNWYPSVDGNPGQPVRVMDLLVSPMPRTVWLAYCSAGFLKREGRKLLPPSDMWKQYLEAPAGFADEVTCYEDLLGLPMNVDLYTPTGQPIVQYRVAGFARTNVLALPWTFPLEFHLAQFRPAQTNGWELDFIVKGTLTSIRQVEAPVELRTPRNAQ